MRRKNTDPLVSGPLTTEEEKMEQFFFDVTVELADLRRDVRELQQGVIKSQEQAFEERLERIRRRGRKKTKKKKGRRKK